MPVRANGELDLRYYRAQLADLRSATSEGQGNHAAALDSIQKALDLYCQLAKEAPDDPKRLLEILRIMDHDLRNAFGIARPRIMVCGLNPHAGESGLLGDEEIHHISPAIDAARAAGIDAHGPVPADTAFVPREIAKADAFLAMFHDQGLPVLKHAGFGHAVNVTLGLPVIRTSVDHGTALTLAGSGRADVGSLRAAVELAVELVHRRRAAAAQSH